jgi:hypothetical protein
MRAAVFQLGDPGLRIGRALPVRVGQLLALAIASQPHQILGRRRLDAALAAARLSASLIARLMAEAETHFAD